MTDNWLVGPDLFLQNHPMLDEFLVCLFCEISGLEHQSPVYRPVGIVRLTGKIDPLPQVTQSHHCITAVLQILHVTLKIARIGVDPGDAAPTTQ